MNLSRLMKENVLQVGTVEYVPSKRITDDYGEPVVFKLRPLTNDEIEQIQKKNTKKFFNRKTGQPATRELDAQATLDDMILAALVDPSQADLEQAELQDSWGVFTPAGVLKAMLNPGEYQDLGSKVQELAGFEAVTFAEIVEDVKKN
jgi:hypothetical protein